MSSSKKIVQDILSFQDTLDNKETRGTFCKTIEANNFLMQNPNAFLFGVIFDQSIPAERAWEAPYLLSKRLGHFSISSFVVNGPDALRDAVKQKPGLHRYTYLGNWIYEASVKLSNEYGGDAKNIWPRGVKAKELLKRLLEFKGIGQKKANMACIILYSIFNVNIVGLEDVDIPYDVHIRRVFLRSGLIKNDDIKEVLSVGRKYSSKYPGKVDNATWEIGRTFCHPTNPNCKNCPLTKTCAKLIFKDINKLKP